MKRKIFAYLCALVLLIAPGFLSGQNPPAPNGGNNPSGVNSAVGGGAPLGGGLLIMLTLAAAYGTKKIVTSRKRLLE